MESKFGYQPFPYTCTEKNVLRTKEDMGTEKGMEYLSENQSGNLDDVKYFQYQNQRRMKMQRWSLKMDG